MKQGDWQKMNLTFTVKLSNGKLPALFRNRNSWEIPNLTSLIYDPPYLWVIATKRGTKSHLANTNLTGKQQQKLNQGNFQWSVWSDIFGVDTLHDKGDQIFTRDLRSWSYLCFWRYPKHGSEQLYLTSQLDTALKLDCAGTGPDNLQKSALKPKWLCNLMGSDAL